MKSLFTIFLAAMFGMGCYTQVKSSGDYWGYTGRHQREKVEVVRNQELDTSAYQDSLGYADDQRSRDDEGYTSYDTYYDDNYYNAPNWGYYNAPYVGLSFGFGWHRPWWNLGYSSYYPYYGSYDPYWDWYYQPGFFSYGCVAPIYPFYDPFYHPFYGAHFGGFREGSGGGGRLSNTGVRSGRINGGENRGRGNQIIGSGVGTSGSARSGNLGRSSIIPATGLGIVQSSSLQSETQSNTGRSQQTQQPDDGTQQGATTESNTTRTVTTTSTTESSAAKPAQVGRTNEQSRSNDNSVPARSNENAAPARQNGNTQEPAKSASPSHSGGRSQIFMNAPRNNPRLTPQSNRRGRLAQNYTPHGYSNRTATYAPRQSGYTDGSGSYSGGYHRSRGRADGNSGGENGGGRSGVGGGARFGGGRGR